MQDLAAAGAAVMLLVVSQMTLAQSSFELADDNNDGRINKEEFYDVITRADVFGAVDTNADNRIDEGELETFEVDAVLTEWDLGEDGYLDRREFYNGIYRYIDEDADGSLSTFDWDEPAEKGWFGVYDSP